MATTTKFGWETPDDTDLVKDGALAMRTLGNAIDTSLVDLKGGTTGQVLSKTSNTDMDFTWISSDDANAIQNTIVDAKGDLITATAADTPARLAVGSNGETLVADSAATTGLRWSGGTTIANPIINSSFQVWQRGTSRAIGATGDFTADRWQGYRNTGGATVSRQTTSDTTNLPNIQYCARVQRDSGNTATGSLLLVQSLETINSIPFAGKTITLSFYARAGANFSAASSQLGVKFQTGTGTDQNALMTGYTGLTNAIDSNATLTTTWQRFSFTATLATNTTEIAPYFTFVPTGTAGANDYFEITGVQIDVGSVALPFRTYAGTLQGELAACQRYFTRFNTDSNARGLINGAWYSTTLFYSALPLPVQMRTYPTLTVSAGTIFTAYSNGSSFVSTAVALDSANDKAVILKLTSSGATAGHGGFASLSTANAYVDLSAEL